MRHACRIGREVEGLSSCGAKPPRPNEAVELLQDSPRFGKRRPPRRKHMPGVSPILPDARRASRPFNRHNRFVYDGILSAFALSDGAYVRLRPIFARASCQVLSFLPRGLPSVRMPILDHRACGDCTACCTHLPIGKEWLAPRPNRPALPALT